MLDPNDGDVLGRPLRARVQVHVDLASAEHEAGDRIPPVGRPGVVQDRAEGATGQVLHGGGGERVAKQALGGHQDQRPRVFGEAGRLTAQKVEVLGGGGAVGDADVIPGRELEEPLQPAAGVLRPLPLEAVRQEHHQRRMLPPLRAGGDEELVDEHLGAIDKVPELGFPEHQRVGRVDAVAVLEADRGGLREGAVVDRERGPGPRHVVERHMLRAGGGIVQHQVALAEGAALDILPGEADGGAVDQDGGEGEGFGVGPIDLAARGVRDRAAALPLAGELGVRLEVGRQGVDRVVEGAQLVRRDGRLDLPARRPRRHLLVRGGVALGDGAAHLGQAAHGRLLHRRHLVGGDDPLVDEAVRPAGANRGVLGDHLVHLGLGEGGLVPLVVAPAAVTDQIDQEVFAELVAVGAGKPGRHQAGLGVVGVDVDDRDLETFGEVAGVEGGAGVRPVGGEADLVVDDDVDGAAGGVAGQAGEVERFGDDALAGEGGVAVEQDGHACLGVLARRAGLVPEILGGAGHALDHGVDELQVARVRRQDHGHRDQLAGRGVPDEPGTEVVLDVAGAVVGHVRGRRRGAAAGSLEGGQDGGVGFAEDVGHHVETAAVGHPEDDLAGAAGGRRVDDLVQHRHQHVGAFDGEALLAEVGLVDEALEGLDLGETTEKGTLGFRAQLGGIAPALHGVAQPGALARLLNVVEVEGGGAGVDGLKPSDRVRGVGRIDGGRPPDHPGWQRPEGGLVHAVRGEVQLRRARRVAAERVQPDGAVAVFPDRLSQGHRADDRVHGSGTRGGRRGGSSGRRTIGYGRTVRPEDGRIERGKEVPHLGVNRVGILQIPIVELQHVAGVRSVERAQIAHRSPIRLLAARVRLPRARLLRAPAR